MAGWGMGFFGLGWVRGISGRELHGDGRQSVRGKDRERVTSRQLRMNHVIHSVARNSLAAKPSLGIRLSGNLFDESGRKCGDLLRRILVRSVHSARWLCRCHPPGGITPLSKS